MKIIFKLNINVYLLIKRFTQNNVKTNMQVLLDS